MPPPVKTRQHQHSCVKSDRTLLSARLTKAVQPPKNSDPPLDAPTTVEGGSFTVTRHRGYVTRTIQLIAGIATIVILVLTIATGFAAGLILLLVH